MVISGPNCPSTELSWNRIVRVRIVLVPNCPGPNCPGPNCPGPNCPSTLLYIVGKRQEVVVEAISMFSNPLTINTSLVIVLFESRTLGMFASDIEIFDSDQYNGPARDWFLSAAWKYARLKPCNITALWVEWLMGRGRFRGSIGAPLPSPPSQHLRHSRSKFSLSLKPL